MRVSALLLLISLLVSVLAVPLRVKRGGDSRKLSRWQRVIDDIDSYKGVSRRYRRDNEGEDEDDDDDDDDEDDGDRKKRSPRRKRSNSRSRSRKRSRSGSRSRSRSGSGSRSRSRSKSGSRSRSRSGSRSRSRSGSRSRRRFGSKKHTNAGDGMVLCYLRGRRRLFRDRDVQRIIGENGEMAKIITGCVVYRNEKGKTKGVSYTKVIGKDPNGGKVGVAAGTGGNCIGRNCKSVTTGDANVRTNENGATVGKAKSVTKTRGGRNSKVTVGAAGAVNFGD